MERGIILNKPLYGVAAGLGAGLIIGIISNVLYSLDLCGLCLVVQTRGMFAPDDVLVWSLLGWVGHLMMGLILGVVFYYVLYFTGREYALLKGAVFGAIVWYVNIGFISRMVGYFPTAPRAVHLLMLLGYHLLFGLITAGFLLRLLQREAKRHT